MLQSHGSPVNAMVAMSTAAMAGLDPSCQDVPLSVLKVILAMTAPLLASCPPSAVQLPNGQFSIPLIFLTLRSRTETCKFHDHEAQIRNMPMFRLPRF